MDIANKRVLAQAMNYIIENPDEWDQNDTDSCFLGHARKIIDPSDKYSFSYLRSFMRDMTGICSDDCEYLYDGKRTLTEIHAAVQRILNNEPATPQEPEQPKLNLLEVPEEPLVQIDGYTDSKIVSGECGFRAKSGLMREYFHHYLSPHFPTESDAREYHNRSAEIANEILRRGK